VALFLRARRYAASGNERDGRNESAKHSTSFGL
jgi:hypothetical protein